MKHDKLITFSMMIGLLVMGILLVIFNDSPLFVKAMIGGGAALISWGIGNLFLKWVEKEKEEPENSRTHYPVTLYITTPLFVFMAQFLSEFNRTGLITFETFAYSLGVVGTYYIVLHFYEYFLEKWMIRNIPKAVRSFLGWGIVMVCIAIMIVMSIT
ncbi:MAG: hypothetical protein JJU16_07340 [Alkalibacterium sp.]|nr:hypothetical protein [Alkalibacterium sp.]